jgi:hypothetical protein
MTSPRPTDVVSPKLPCCIRHHNPSVSEIVKFLGHKNSVRPEITPHILAIEAAICMTVVRVLLKPLPADPVIDVVTISPLKASVEHRPLGLEARIGPIVVIAMRFAHAHCVDEHT